MLYRESQVLRFSSGRYFSSPQRGFTLIEAILVVGMIAFVGLLATSYLSTWPSRLDLQQATRQTSFLISKARLEAIKRGVSTVVEADLTARTISAFADVNGGEGAPKTLVYDPDPLLPPTKTDYTFGFYRLERSLFLAPSSDPVIDGFTAVPLPPGAPQPVLVFTQTGKPINGGAFRLGDGDGANFFEVAVLDLTGKVEIRKYLTAADSPTGSAGYFAQGRSNTGENLWVWY